MSLLFVLVMLLLAATFWFAARLILAAHRRAARETGRGDVPRAAFDKDQDEATSLAIFRSPQVSYDIALEEPLQTPHPATPPANRDAYADPIDGVPFLQGEHAIPCSCGVAYRAESLDWLAVHCAGRCVQCGSPIQAGQPSLI